MRKIVVALIALSCVPAAVAQQDGYTKLDGSSLTITGKYAIDPPPDQKNDRVGFFLIGEAAKRIYDAMPAKPKNDECEQGMQSKEAGSLSCSKLKGDYVCMVGILLATGQTAQYGAC